MKQGEATSKTDIRVFTFNFHYSLGAITTIFVSC